MRYIGLNDNKYVIKQGDIFASCCGSNCFDTYKEYQDYVSRNRRENGITVIMEKCLEEQDDDKLQIKHIPTASGVITVRIQKVL